MFHSRYKSVQNRAVLTKIFQLTSITKNLNDAHELLTSCSRAAHEHENGGHFVFYTASQRHIKLAV